MSAPLPVALRSRFQRLIEEGLSGRAAAANALREAGWWILFLSPYSPDLNAIEMAFSKFKAHLRRIGAKTFTDMFDAIAQICNLYSPSECWTYFKAAGYVSGSGRDDLSQKSEI